VTHDRIHARKPTHDIERWSVGTISEETTAGAESVAAAAEERTTALTEVSTSAERLSNQAPRLSRAPHYFETDAATASASPTDA